jgi:hypothetical protein
LRASKGIIFTASGFFQMPATMRPRSSRAGGRCVVDAAMPPLRQYLVQTILSTYVHEFERAKRQDEIREKLAARTSIRVA